MLCSATHFFCASLALLSFGIVATVAQDQRGDLALVQLSASRFPRNRTFSTDLDSQSRFMSCGKSLFPLKDLKWMHIPKCGTSFQRTLEEVNPHHFRDGHFHQPLAKDVSNAEVAKFTTMLRDPGQRLASALTYIEKIGPQLGWFFASGSCDADTVYHLLKEGKTPVNDECLASLLGCQTNMLLGTGCMEGRQHNISDLALAKDRLDKFYFVGILEEWELSMCLLNFKLTGKRFVQQCQLLDTRPTDTSGPRTEATANVYDVKGYPHDTFDSAVYRHGKARFNQELAKHEINKDSCKYTFDGELRE